MSQFPFAHELQALRTRQRIKDEEVLGRVPRRRRRSSDSDQLKPQGPGRRTGIDWWAPSFLVEWSRWSGDVRIPCLWITSIAKCEVPRAVDGRTHARYPDQAAQAELHFGYIERQDRAARSILLHGNCIDHKEVRGCDVQEGYHGHVLTNIHRNPAIRRDFARRVWAAERNPRPPRLLAWSSDAEWWDKQAASAGAPRWVRAVAELVGSAARAAETKAQAVGRTAKPFQIDLGQLCLQDAYERLSWVDSRISRRDVLPKLEFSSRYGGRVQYRIVWELPYGLTAKERFEVARAIARWCKRSRFMYVIAVHRPDAHNDPRNYHLHIDVYDRPCRWLKRYKQWDFEVTVKARNGDLRYPFRQNKPPEFSRDKDKGNHREYGKTLVQDLRKIFVELTNEVLERTTLQLRYHPGPAEALGLAITPTKKLGGRKMAAERHGVRTPEGDHSAEAIWRDRFAAIDQARHDAREQDEARVANVRAALNACGRLHNDNGLRLSLAVVEWAAELARIRELRHHLERTDVEFARARSRAEAVLREAAKASEREQTEGAFRTSEFSARRADLVAEAQEHLELVRSIAPAPGRIEAERAAVAQLSALAAVREEGIERSVAALHDEPMQNFIRLELAKISAPGTATEIGRDERLEIDNRVGSYLRSSPNCIDRRDGYLAVEAPPAILTLLAKHRHTTELGQLLLQAAERRHVAPARPVPDLSAHGAVPHAPAPVSGVAATASPKALTPAAAELAAAPGDDKRTLNITTDMAAAAKAETVAADALRVAALLEEIRDERWMVYRGPEGYQVSRVRLETRADDWTLVSRAFRDEAVQDRLSLIHAEQEREIALVVESVEALQEVPVAKDGVLDAGAIAGLEELVRAWRFKEEVKKAVIKRQAAIARARAAEIKTERRAPAPAAPEVTQKAERIDDAEFSPAAAVPPTSGPTATVDPKAVAGVAPKLPPGPVAGSGAAITDERSQIDGLAVNNGATEAPRDRRVIRPEAAAAAIATESGSAGNRLQEGIRSDEIQRSVQSSSASQVALNTGEARLPATGPGAAPADAQPQTPARGGISKGTSSGNPEQTSTVDRREAPDSMPIASAAPAITRRESETGAPHATSGDGVAQKPQQDHTSGAHLAASPSNLDPGSSRSRLEARIRAGDIRKSAPSSSAIEVARSMAQARSSAAASGAVAENPQPQATTAGAIASDDDVAQKPQQDQMSGGHLAASPSDLGSGSSRRRLEARIRAGELKKAAPSSSAIKVARSMAQARSSAAASGAVAENPQRQAATHGAFASGLASQRPDHTTVDNQTVAPEAVKPVSIETDRKPGPDELPQAGGNPRSKGAPNGARASGSTPEEYGVPREAYREARKQPKSQAETDAEEANMLAVQSAYRAGKGLGR